MFCMRVRLTTQKTIDEPKQGVRFIGSRVTEGKVALSRWTVWRMEAEGRFPRSIRIGHKRVWIESEVEAWMAERIASRDTLG
jgi:prophage regulatory protein